MKIVDFSEINKQEWDNFCLKSDSAWLRHTSHWIKFSEENGDSNLNLSFGVIEDGKLLAVIPLIAQPIPDEAGLMEFEMGGNSIPFPVLLNSIPDSLKNEIIKLIFKEIDNRAKNHKISYSRFFIDPLIEPLLNDFYKSNPLLEFGFNDSSLATNIIDLSLEEDSILRGMRKGHKSDIKFALKNKDQEVVFFDKENISSEIFDKYKDIYFSAAGKKVGNDKRWKNTLELIKDGFAILIMIKRGGNYISGIIILCYKNKSYYGFSATLPDFKKERGVGHLLQWETIKYLKNKGFKYYETGWNFLPIISEDVYSQKELNISFFKAGFGGKKYPLFRGEKFYDLDYSKKRRIQLEKKYKDYYGE
ncbi:GNAT family N-acetyltransferase [Patescibacteria group bacterium]|nr:GNAT family N-acetyltransferase [Patescibacteria group bacterium]